MVDSRKKKGEGKKTALVFSGNCSNSSCSAILGVINKDNFNVHNYNSKHILQMLENLLCAYNGPFSMAIKVVIKETCQV